MRKLNKLASLLAVVFLWTGCSESLEDTYSDYAGDGRIHYLAKCTNLTATAGWKRIYLEWQNGVDAMVEGIKVTWSANDVEHDTILPPEATECTLENLVDGSYRIDICTVSGDDNSLVETTYLRPYTESHEIVLTFTRGIAKCYRIGNNLAFFTDMWSDNIEEVVLHYTGTDKQQHDFELSREVYEKQFATVEGIDFSEPVTITRSGRIEGCPDLIEFDPLSLNTDPVFTSDFKMALQRRYGITDKTPAQKEEFDRFVEAATELEIDYDITSLEDVLCFPKLEKLILGKNRYLDKTYNMAYPGRSVLREEERSEEVLAIAHEWAGLAIERYADHYFETAPEYVTEMGIPDRKVLDELAYVQLSDVDTITNTVENPAGYHFKLEDLLDNNPSTSWTASDSYTEARTHEITIELKEPKAIKGLKFAQPLQPLSWAGSYFPVSAIVTVSPDGISWSNLAYVEESIIGGGAGEVTLIPAADPKDIKFIRIEMTDVTDLYNSGYTITIGDIIPYY